MKKPLDLGNGLVCASFDRDGAWLSLGTTHSRHGFVELTALPRFDEPRRGDPAAVRRYRGLMTESRHAFLRLDAPGWRRVVCNRAPAGRSELEQLVLLTSEQPEPPLPVLRFRGTLDRPAFAEITEVSPPQPTGAVTSLRADGPTLRIEARELPAVAEVHAAGGSWELADGAAALVFEGARELELRIVCSLRETPK
ncbi:MAG TPA: hypothetical protein VH416_00800 [Gaiellaceae bacterium]